MQNVLNHLDGSWVVGTLVFCVCWRFKWITGYKSTVIYSIMYTFGGLLQYWGKP